MLDFSLHQIEYGSGNNFSEGHQRHKVGVGLANNEMVHIEHFGQLPERQIILKAAIMPSPLNANNGGCCKPAPALI